ncbi:MAG TPA: low temperature requirement protein A, partial [Planctomycetota bacterium]|nr:low temperature requirement protein A [Planctomycetota bacterium]
CYFELLTHGPRRSGWVFFVWGYGYLLIFAAAAAVGSGFGVEAELLGGHGEIPAWQGGLAVGIPAALYVLGVWWVVIRCQPQGWVITSACWAAALGIPALALSPYAVPLIALVFVAVVVVLVRRPG